ncbi:MAG: hypothetical protein HC831_10340 [Chloroflexia bacterium]|nr:hypothetical protein [Chloroflexia bacterium]
MKKLTIITFLTLLGFVFAPNLFAQGTDLFSFMEEHLTSSEQEQLKRAKDNIAKGDKLESQIKEEDQKVQKYFTKNKKKGEKNRLK